jgi:hypothetical protein
VHQVDHVDVAAGLDGSGDQRSGAGRADVQVFRQPRRASHVGDADQERRVPVVARMQDGGRRGVSDAVEATAAGQVDPNGPDRPRQVLAQARHERVAAQPQVEQRHARSLQRGIGTPVGHPPQVQLAGAVVDGDRDPLLSGSDAEGQQERCV